MDFGQVRTQHRALVVSVLLVMVTGLSTACGTDTTSAPTPTAAHFLNRGEVEQLFRRWVCPNEPASFYVGTLQVTELSGETWQIKTSRNFEFTMRESTRVVVPTTDGAGRWASNLRSTC